MVRLTLLIAAISSFLFVTASRAAESDSAAAVPTAKQLIADMDAVQLPQPDHDKLQSDPDYRQQFAKEYTEAQQKRTQIGRQLLDNYPDDPATFRVMGLVWTNAGMNDAEKTKAEIDQYIANARNEKNINEAKYIRTMIVVRTPGDSASKLAAINQFITDVPEMKDNGASMLLGYSEGLPPAEAQTVLQRVIDQFPDTAAAKRAVGMKKLVSAPGQPFELEFTDAISGNKISTSDMKGKVIVVDFWATWCGPCVGEMPKMKELYSQYKDKGVEFIGVSLDEPEAQGGLKALKDFVAKNEIGWPQDYQGNGWDSEFSRSWGIMSIPHVFVIDQSGNVVTTDGRGKLESLLPKLLEKQG